MKKKRDENMMVHDCDNDLFLLLSISLTISMHA